MAAETILTHSDVCTKSIFQLTHTFGDALRWITLNIADAFPLCPRDGALASVNIRRRGVHLFPSVRAVRFQQPPSDLHSLQAWHTYLSGSRSSTIVNYGTNHFLGTLSDHELWPIFRGANRRLSRLSSFSSSTTRLTAPAK